MIDIHTHLWNPDTIPKSIRSYFAEKEANQFQARFCTAEGLLERMDDAGIQKAVVLALAYSRELSFAEVSRINDYVIKETEKSERLEAFCTVSPFEGEKALLMLSKFMEELGCKGLKLHGNMQELYPNDSLCYPIYRKMEYYRKPVLFHTGGIGLKAYKDKYSNLEYFDDIACDFPEMPIILGHAGRFEYEKLAAILRKHKNCYADISTNFSRDPELASKPLERLVHTVKEWVGDTGQLLFGTDFPFYSQKQTMDYVGYIDTGKNLRDILELNTHEFCKKYRIFQEV